MRRARRLAAVALLSVSLVGCSPEAQRARGEGLGADIRNVDSRLEMHQGAEPGYKVPALPAPVGAAGAPTPAPTGQ